MTTSSEDLPLDAGSGTHESQLVTMGGQLSPADLIRAVIDKGVTLESVGVVERLVALAERQEARGAEKQFAAAFVALQSEMPNIQASRAVPNKDNSIRYKFAPFEDIMEAVKPLLRKHGFTVSFSMSFADGRVIQACMLQHTGGHSRTNQFMARIGHGPPGSSEAQGDGAASTYAKRFALCDALNITIEHDSDGADARNEGAPIAEDKAIYLRELCKEVGANVEKFLKYAGAATFETIGSARYEELVAELNKRRTK